MLKNYYDILSVDKTADMKEIKKSYARLVRQYPPETHPEEFKEIRRAYEVLSNPASRAEYDNLLNYGYYEEEDEKDSEKSYKETYNRTYSHSYKESYEETYYEAEEHKKSKGTEKDGLQGIFKRFYLLCDLQKFDEAIVLLKTTIEADDSKSSQKMLYYLELIKLYTSMKRMPELKDAFNDFFTLFDFAARRSSKEYVVSELRKVVRELIIKKRYSYARVIVNKLLEIDMYNRDLENLKKTLDEITNSKTLLPELYRDKDIEDCFKRLIALWLNEEIDPNDRELLIQQISKTISSISTTKIVKSVQKIQISYKVFYTVGYAFFEKIKMRYFTFQEIQNSNLLDQGHVLFMDASQFGKMMLKSIVNYLRKFRFFR